MFNKKPKDSTERFGKTTAILSVLFIALIGVLALTYSFAAPKNGKGGRNVETTSSTAAVVADSVNLYLSPSSQKVPANQEFTVAVWVDSKANPITAVQANLEFDSNRMEFLSIDANDSAFSVQAQSTIEDGVIKIARGSFTPVQGNSFVANVKFRALRKTRSTQVSFANNSELISSDTIKNILEATNPGTVTIR